MSLPKILSIFTVILFASIGIAAFFKNSETKKTAEKPLRQASREIQIEEIRIVPAQLPPVEEKKEKEKESIKETAQNTTIAPAPVIIEKVNTENRQLPENNRIEQLFQKGDTKLPFVETIVYKSRVPWQKGRPAWVSDYASYYQTSRHFIARSLNGKADYFKQDVSEGDRFNVLKKDYKLEFYLLVDASRNKLWLYAYDVDNDTRYLLKTYAVGLGRVDPARTSGLLTPTGKYSLGDKTAIYKPSSTGIHNNEKVEMIKVFGTRWIPFDKEIANCSAPSKGLGIHGVPWSVNNKGILAEDASSLGKYESDGCIRFSSNDIEEIYAIIITKPSYIEIVKDFFDAKLPGKQEA